MSWEFCERIYNAVGDAFHYNREIAAILYVRELKLGRTKHLRNLRKAFSCA